MSGILDGLKAYLRAPFVVIVWFMETYDRNRARLKAFMAHPRVADVFKGLVVLTVLAWVVLAFAAREEDRQRLTDAVKTFWEETREWGEEKKALDAQREAEPEAAQ